MANNTIDNAIVTLNDGEGSENMRPYVGMIFKTGEDAYVFYNAYARRMGFGTKRHTTRKICEEVVKKYFTCSREGHKRKRESMNTSNTTLEERCECKSRMIIKKHDSIDGSWVVTNIIEEHNHELLHTPTKIKKLRSHNRTHLESATKSLVNELHDCNVGPAQSARILNTISSNPDLYVTAGQCSQILRAERKNNVGSQCALVVQHFIDRQRREPQFFYAVEIDDIGVCRSLFWADERARTSYFNFSDVLVFDVTYRTNNFLLPFAPFTGVNHHRQSTLFGCALLADETEETFVWLFTNWLNCMLGKEPRAIITDQDTSICNAIRRVFPNTCHHYCIWHITLHEDEHLRSLRTTYGGEFNYDYNQWNRYSKSIDESEKCWVKLNERYRGEDESFTEEKRTNHYKAWRWLDSMYEKRHHWVVPYLKGTFFAGMKSSQRSESMNAFFDGFVRSRTPLVEFVRQYEQAVITQREKEENEDKICMKTEHSKTGMHELEAHAANVYTRKMFDIFSKEFKHIFYCKHNFNSPEGSFISYTMSCRLDGVVTSSVVRCDNDGSSFFCDCAKFESMGILCKHVLYIMKQKYDLLYIPEKYLLPRWTLACRYSTFKKCSSVSSSSINSGTKLSPLDSWKLRSEMNDIVDIVENNSILHSHVASVISSLKQYCEVQKASTNSQRTSEVPASPSSTPANDPSETSPLTHTLQLTFPSSITIFDPAKCARKGRPPTTTRYKSSIERASDEMDKRTRTCSLCGKKGHDVRTCKKEM